MSSITPAETEQFLEVPVKLRLATSKDFHIEINKIENSVLKTEYKPKIGQPYWLKSVKTGKVDNKNYQISDNTDWSEFKKYLRLDMVYVPASYFEINKENNA